MATYTEETAKHATLVNGVVDTVNLTKPNGFVRVVNRSASDIFVRPDGIDPTVEGNDCYVVLGNNDKVLNPPNTSAIQVRIIGGTNKYSVEGFSG